jgi:acyl-CoA dehydrogenase
MSVIGSTAIQFSEEQAMILDSAREFCRDKSPISAVRAQLDSKSGFDISVWDEMVSLGWAGISLPDAYGGSGLGVSSLVPVVECMGRAMLGTPLVSSALAGQLILRAGQSEQLERLLPNIASGIPATLALLENADWGDSQLRCTLDSNLHLQGSKRFVADAGVAELFVVSVLHQGVPALVVVHA